MSTKQTHVRGVPTFVGTGPDLPVCGARGGRMVDPPEPVTCPACLAWIKRHQEPVTCPDCLAWIKRHQEAVK